MKKSCGFLIQCFDRFLLCHSSRPDGIVSLDDGQWGIPKGGCEDDETEMEAALRETLEETGIDLTKYSFKKKPLIKYSTKTKKYIIFYAKINDKSLFDLELKCSTMIDNTEVPENDDYVWVDWNQARDIAIKNQKFNIFVEDVRREIFN